MTIPLVRYWFVVTSIKIRMEETRMELHSFHRYQCWALCYEVKSIVLSFQMRQITNLLSSVCQCKKFFHNFKQGISSFRNEKKKVITHTHTQFGGFCCLFFFHFLRAKMGSPGDKFDNYLCSGYITME